MMKCENIQKLIPNYLDDDLEVVVNKQVKEHLSGCPNCSKELLAFEDSWNILGELEEIQPQPGFIGRFWTRLSYEQSWHERIWRLVEETWQNNRLVPVMVTVCVIVIVGLTVFQNYMHIEGTNQALANLSVEDLEMIDNIELAENFDLIADIEFFEDLNIIENFDVLET